MTYARHRPHSKTYMTGRTSWAPSSPSTQPNCCHHHINPSLQHQLHRPEHSVSVCKMSSLFQVLKVRSQRNLHLHVSLDRVAPVLKQGTVSRRFLWRVRDSQRTSAGGSPHPRIGGQSLLTVRASVGAAKASMQVNALWTTNRAALHSIITI
jgi:hypothetical protein